MEITWNETRQSLTELQLPTTDKVKSSTLVFKKGRQSYLYFTSNTWDLLRRIVYSIVCKYRSDEIVMVPLAFNEMPNQLCPTSVGDYYTYFWDFQRQPSLKAFNKAVSSIKELCKTVDYPILVLINDIPYASKKDMAGIRQHLEELLRLTESTPNLFIFAACKENYKVLLEDVMTRFSVTRCQRFGHQYVDLEPCRNTQLCDLFNNRKKGCTYFEIVSLNRLLSVYARAVAENYQKGIHLTSQNRLMPIAPLSTDDMLSLYREWNSCLPVFIVENRASNRYTRIMELNDEHSSLYVYGRTGSGFGNLRNMIVLSAICAQTVTHKNMYIIDRAGDMEVFMRQSVVNVASAQNNNRFIELMESYTSMLDSNNEPKLFIINGLSRLFNNITLLTYLSNFINKVNATKNAYVIVFNTQVGLEPTTAKAWFNRFIFLQIKTEELRDYLSDMELPDDLWCKDYGVYIDNVTALTVHEISHMSTTALDNSLEVMNEVAVAAGEEVIPHKSELKFFVSTKTVLTVQKENSSDMELILPARVRLTLSNGRRIEAATLTDKEGKFCITTDYETLLVGPEEITTIARVK